MLRAHIDVCGRHVEEELRMLDDIDPKNDKKDLKPYSALMGAIVRHLGGTVPALAMFASSSCCTTLDILNAALKEFRIHPFHAAWNRV